MSRAYPQVLRGFLALAGVNLAFFVVGWMVMYLVPRDEPGPWYSPAGPPVYLVGLTQILWCLPWQLWAFLTGRKHFGFGLVIAAALTALLNGALVVYFLASLGAPH